MHRSIYGFIFKHSLPQQIVLVVLTFAALPFIYLQAELPKQIVNDAIAADSGRFPISLDGFDFEKITYLFVLCGTFLFLVMVNGGFKYVLKAGWASGCCAGFAMNCTRGYCAFRYSTSAGSARAS